jgi:protein transport protein SEC31
LKNPTRPYSPGSKSARIEDVYSLAWNPKAGHILASSSNNGYTVVWDLRGKKELMQLACPAGRHSISSISWNPDNVFYFFLYLDDSNCDGF